LNALYVESAAFSPDGLKIVAVSRDATALHGRKGLVRVWSVTGKCEQTVVVGDRNWRTESVIQQCQAVLLGGNGQMLNLGT
jgi:hypothetical protein